MFQDARTPVIVVMLLVFTTYTAFSVQQWRVFTIRSWDLGIFSQLAQRYASMDAPIVDIKGPGVNLLGDHFHPALVILGPVWAAFPSPLALLVFQNLLFAASIYPIARLAQRHLGTAAGALFGAAYGLSWGLQGAVDAQFHEIALAVPLLAASLQALSSRRWRAAAYWAAPLVFVKEDLGLTVVVIAVLIFIQGNQLVGLTLTIWGAAWFLLAVAVIVPLLNGDGSWQYGAGFSSGVRDVDSWLGSLLAPQKFETVLWLGLASGFIALRSPLALIMVPTLAWRFLSSNAGYWGHTWHYSAVLMPILFVAALDGISRARFGRSGWLRRYALVVPAVIITVAALLFPQAPVGAALTTANWAASTREAAAEGALQAVTAGSRIESDVSLMPYLVPIGDVYWVGNSNPPPDFIVVDLYGGGLASDWESVRDVAEELHPEVDYDVVYDRDGYQVAARAGQ